MSSSAMSTEDVLDEIERLDQSITRTLLEIDQSFSNCQIIVSSKILPQIDRYAESSAEVWKNARVWLNFFEAANAPTPPAPGRRTQAVRNAVSKQRAAGAFNSSVSGNGPSAGTDSTTPEYSFRRQSRQDDIADNSTNRPRIDSINLSSARLSPTFMAHSPGDSMLSTPTPLHGSRNARSRQQENIAPPAPIRWSQDTAGERQNESSALNQSVGTTTPIRSRYQYNRDALERASTTPTITLRDRPMSLSHYTQAASAAKSPSRTSQSRYRSQQTSERERGSVEGGFLQLDVEENHQDVITPPSTLHFSIPESKLAGTPRSVVAKSLVDKIRMKDGLVIPQPIFVNDDEDEDVATLEQYTGLKETAAGGTSVEETGGIGGSKKRSRDGDLLDADFNNERDGGRSRSWASLTDQQRNRERLLKSPRKMASVQDFFDASPPAPPAPPNLNALAPSQGATQDERDEEDGSQSPSRQLMSQIQSQAESFEDDPLLAALATPPEVRKTIREHKARFSVVQRPVSAPTALSAPVARSSSTVSTSVSTAPASTSPTTAAEAQSAAERIRDSVMSSTTVNGTGRTLSSTSGSTSHHVALLTTAPVGATAVETPALRTARSNIDTIFKESFSSGFASSSNNRRQTMATPVDLTRTPQNNSLLNSNRGAGGNNRNSVGSGARNSIGTGFSSLLTPKPFGGAARPGAPGSTASSRLSLLGTSAFRKPLHPTSPSPASRAAANAIASATAAAQDVLSQKSGISTSDHQQSVAQTSQSNRSNGLTRLTQPAGMGRFSIGGGYGSAATGGRASATPIVSTANFLAQAQDAQQTTTLRNSVGRASQEGSDISSRGSHTPFSMREPPPAPRLGYHSDTMMTQSSLGLNHDGFGGYDSEDRTRMTMASGGESGNAAVSSHERSLAAIAASSTNNATMSASRRMEDEGTYGGDEGDDDDDDDDDDVTGSIMKSPCPPGRTGSIPFLGSRTDLKSVAQAATARPAGGRTSILGGSAASTSAGSNG
ncbi:DASH complex subunit ask1, partial [Mortierella alpina]